MPLLTQIEREVSGMRMEFRLLGPLEAAVDGRLVPIGSGKRRNLLAALLLRPGEAVSVAELTDEVWGDSPPRDPVTALQMQVSRLRQLLSGAPAGTIAAAPGGYLLRIEPDTVDLQRFERLAAEGRRALARTAPGEAAAALENALALWRGQPLADVPSDRLQRTVVPRLGEARLAALEDRIDADLWLGRHTALAGELRELVAAHPYRERLCGQLMLALYRAGRQAEALAAYQDTRTVLTRDLGIEPGPELRRLEHSILTADEALDPPRATAGTADRRQVTPAQLPADIPHFTARAGELGRLDARLDAADGNGATVVISGTAGIGKTALALHWAHRVRDGFPDGQLYVNLRGFDPNVSATSTAEALGGFLDVLEVPPDRRPASLDAQVGLYRSLLSGLRVLVVLDNARDTDQVRPLLPGSAGCAAVVTSRSPLTSLVVDGAHPLTLDVLELADARRLLARRLGEERLRAEPEAVADIVAACSGLPLALAIVAARAGTRPDFPLSVVAGDMRRSGNALDTLSTGERTGDIRAVFSWSYRMLSADAARLFRLLGLHPGPDVAAPAAASLAGATLARGRQLLAELVHAHLVTEHAPGRYRCHDLLRQYARELAESTDSAEDRDRALRRMFDHYLLSAHAAALLLNPGRDPLALEPAGSEVTTAEPGTHGDALGWFGAEHLVLTAAVDMAADGRFDRHAWQLAWTMWDFLQQRGYYRQWVGVQQTALPATRRLGEPIAEALTLRGLGRAYARLDRHGDARTHLQQAVDLFAANGKRADEANAHLSLSWLCDRQARHDDALHHARQALDLYQEAGHRAGMANALNAVGWCHTKLGEHERAGGYVQRALDLLHELGDRVGEADAWDSLALANVRGGDRERAIECYRKAVEIFRSTGHTYGEMCSVRRLGDTLHAAGDADAARQAWQRALDLQQHLNHAS